MYEAAHSPIHRQISRSEPSAKNLVSVWDNLTDGRRQDNMCRRKVEEIRGCLKISFLIRTISSSDEFVESYSLPRNSHGFISALPRPAPRPRGCELENFGRYSRPRP